MNMKRTSLIILALAFCAFAAEYGVKLAGSGACVRACGAPGKFYAIFGGKGTESQCKND